MMSDEMDSYVLIYCLFHLEDRRAYLVVCERRLRDLETSDNYVDFRAISRIILKFTQR